LNRHDVKLLQSIRHYPNVSLLAPTHRTSPENKQDPVRVKNLVTEAIGRLREEFGPRETASLEKRLSDAIEAIDWQFTLDGIAIYANADMARVFKLPFKVRQRVIVDETFATRDLVYTLNRSPRYWVLALSEKPTRLFEGYRDRLDEVTTDGFPITHQGPGGGAPLPGGVGVNTSAVRDAQHREFFRKVDGQLGELQQDDTLPIIVCGVDRYLAFYREVSAHGEHIAGELKGSYDFASPHEVAQRVWPLMLAHLDAQRAKAIGDLDRAVSARKFVSAIDEVWRAAHEGRVADLVVEDDYHVPGVVDGDNHLTLVGDATTPGVIDDVVDELIEKVLELGGRVRFVADGSITDSHQRIAAILRY